MWATTVQGDLFFFFFKVFHKPLVPQNFVCGRPQKYASVIGTFAKTLAINVICHLVLYAQRAAGESCGAFCAQPGYGVLRQAAVDHAEDGPGRRRGSSDVNLLSPFKRAGGPPSHPLDIQRGCLGWMHDLTSIQKQLDLIFKWNAILKHRLNGNIWRCRIERLAQSSK